MTKRTVATTTATAAPDHLAGFPGLAAGSREVFSRPREEWPEETPAFGNNAEKKLLVWWPDQAVPAKCYGDTHYGVGNFDIIVCRDPNRPKAKYGDTALVYHFGSGTTSGGGGGGGGGR